MGDFFAKNPKHGVWSNVDRWSNDGQIVPNRWQVEFYTFGYCILCLPILPNTRVRMHCIRPLLVELIRAKKQWAPAIFSTAILLGTNIPWVGQKKNLHGDTLYLCK